MVFAGEGSPLSHVVGAGMTSACGAAELDQIEAFYRSRGGHCEIEVTPHTDRDLILELSRRAYLLEEFQSVLVRWLSGDLGPPSDSVRTIRPEESEQLAAVAIAGFFPDTPVNEEMAALAARVSSHGGYLGFDGEKAVACGHMAVWNGIAHLAGDATLPSFQGRGHHQAIIRRRIQDAAALGCDIATASTLPGSTSQRNYERCGFRVAYTKLVFRKVL